MQFERSTASRIAGKFAASPEKLSFSCFPVCAFLSYVNHRIVFSAKPKQDQSRVVRNLNYPKKIRYFKLPAASGSVAKCQSRRTQHTRAR